MSSRHLVDPDILPLLDLVPPIDLNDQTLGPIRQKSSELLIPMNAGAPKLIEIENPEGVEPIPLRIFMPASDAKISAVIFHIHGGGFVLGSAAMNDARNRALCDEIGAAVVSVDYRLAPEHPFPAPLEDCYSALCWVANNADALGIDDHRIAVLGESAGGGLAAALALLARDRGGPVIAGQYLIYPMLDMRSGSSLERDDQCPAGEFIWTPANNRYGWAAMRGQGTVSQAQMPYLSPSLAADLRGLPATFIAVGALDLFRDENLAYGQKLAEAGVATELHMYSGATHGFDLVATSNVAQRFEKDLTSALVRGLSLP